MESSSRSHRDTIRYLFNKFFCRGNHPGCIQFLAPDISVHLPPSLHVLHTPEVQGIKDVNQIDQALEDAFEITKLVVCDIIPYHNKVLVRWECEGIQRGNYFHLLAANRAFSLSGQNIYLFNENGQIGEIWHTWDTHNLLKSFQRDAPAFPQEPLLVKQAARLTPRERDCLHLLLEGKTAQESADQLALSRRTIEYYLENIKVKLDCFTKRELFALCRLFEKHDLL